MDLRLIVLAKRAFRVTVPLRRQALVDHIQLVMGCSSAEAIGHLHDLAEEQYVLVRGATAHETLVFPGPFLETGQLGAKGLSVDFGI